MKVLSRKAKPLSGFAMGLVLTSSFAIAAPPAGYYNSVNTSSPSTLKSSLHEIIDDHTRFPYTSSATDTWDILEVADQDPDNPNNIIDVYKNASYPKAGGGNSNYNREHTWPKSFGFPNDGSDNYPYTDAHHLFLSDSSYNSSRSNKPYANCAGCSTKVTELNNNRGGSNAEVNRTSGSSNTGSWETWSGRRGDVARALMYLAVRYEGGSHGVTGVVEPDLILTDDRTLIGNSKTGSNVTVAYMGLKSVLLQWHAEDPVDDYERRHTDAVFANQGNRNPFVDRPEYVACVFSNDCSALGGSTGGDTTAPSAPVSLSASGGNALVALAWTANTESDLAGYNVYRSTSSASGFVKINTSLVTTAAYSSENLNANTTYFYKVTAVDASGNESAQSATASATTDNSTTPPATGNAAWINEFHYDNASSDTNEAVEIAGTAGTSLAGWKVVAYNGNGGVEYKTINLSGTLADQQNGFGALNFAASGLQNGANDGLALIDNNGAVVQFISYEGTLTATNGPASGTTSVNVGVAETSSTAAGLSLQLVGSGSSYSDFTWQGPVAHSRGALNTNQTLTGGTPPPPPPPPPANVDPTASFTFNCTDLTCNFNGNGSSDSDGSITTLAWDFGDSATSTGAAVTRNFASAGTYTVTLTVTDNQGATNSQSQQVTVTAIAPPPPPPPPATNVLTNGETKTGLSLAKDAELDYTIVVPAGATNLNVVLSGGTGDSDLYVRFGAEPTLSTYDCRPYLNGNNESCPIATPSAGTYHIKVIGFAASSNLTLTASYTEPSTGGGGTTPTVPSDTVVTNNVSASTGNWQYFTVEVPAGVSNLEASIAGGSGDADLYVRFGAQPTTSSYDCRPFRNGNAETCNQANPQAGTWHVGVRAYSTFSGVTLTTTY